MVRAPARHAGGQWFESVIAQFLLVIIFQNEVHFKHFNIKNGRKMKSRHLYFMNHARVTATASSCTYFQVGSVIVKNDRIISHGYNGTPKGFPEDCPDYFCGDPAQREAHHEFSERTTIHSEMNALLWAARTGISVENASLYVTLEPCHNCVKACVAAGIIRIIYDEFYDKHLPYSQEFCQKSGVELISLEELLKKEV